MSTDAQLTANRSNALASTGPVTAEGKSRVSRNALTAGLFSSTDFVRADEQDIYSAFCTAYEADLAPSGAIEQTLAAEILHAAWRLRRCSTVEAGMKLRDGDQRNENTQLSIDRARADAHRTFTRSINELRKIQTERQLRLKLMPDRADTLGLANCKSLIPTAKEADAAVFTKQTQSEVPAVMTLPRSAPCPCGSGLKYKRCCGKDAPPVLGQAA
jgi:SEC-C motif